MANAEEQLTRKKAIVIGAIGGAIVGLPSYFFVGDIPNIVTNFDGDVVLGIICRIGLFALVGAFYAYVAPLPRDRWSAFERGIMAPTIVAALIFNNTPNAKKLNEYLNSGSLVSVAYAENSRTIKGGKTKSSTIRQIIRGILGK